MTRGIYFRTDEHRKILSKSKTGAKNPKWKGIDRKDKNSEWYINRKKINKERHKLVQQQERLEVLIAYSKNPPECACCGENIVRFLTIDHINNDGNKHRKELGHAGGRLPTWLRKNNYPKGFQVLCYNCNCGKGVNKGVCPHLTSGFFSSNTERVKRDLEQVIKAGYMSMLDQKVMEVKAEIKKGFIKEFFKSGERWYNYAFEDEEDEEIALDQIEKDWEKIINKIQ